MIAGLQTFGQSQSFGASFSTWTQRASALAWTSVACSNNCEVAYAVVNSGSVYKSTDGGSTWSALANSGTYNWKAVATSSDGSIVYAAVTGGYIYKSVDAGLNWTTANGVANRSWISITTDSTGTTVAGGVSTGAVWLSTNSGSTWSEVTAIGTSKVWKGLAVIPSGTVMVAGASSGEIWRGVLSAGNWTWTNITTSKTATPMYGGAAINLFTLGWNSLAIDSTGNRIAAISNDLYFTSDAGTTWRNASWGNYSWASISGSSDLKTMMMLASNGCGTNCRPHIVTTSDYTTFTDTIVGSIGVAYSSGAFAKDASRAIAATSSSFIYTAGDAYTPVATPAITTVPTITGTATFGETLTSSTGAWSNTPTSYSYQWSRASSSAGTYTDISGATSSTYNLVSADVAQYLKVTVTATNSSGSATSTSSASSQIAKATPTFSAWSNVSKVFGDAPYTVSAPTVVGSIPGTFSYSSNATSVISIASTTMTVAGGGSATITATFTPANTAIYNSATTTHVVTVGKLNQSSLTISSISGSFGTALTLSTTGGSGTGGLTYSYAPGTTTCTLAGSTLTAEAHGTCLVTATKVGDANYNDTTSTQATVSFARGTPTTNVVIDVGTLVYRQVKSISAASNTAGKLTFRVNNVFIPGCRNLTVNFANSYTAVCSYRPSTRGFVVITVAFTPANSSYSSSTFRLAPQFVINRTNRR